MTGKPQGALLEFKVFLLVYHWSADIGRGAVRTRNCYTAVS